MVETPIMTSDEPELQMNEDSGECTRLVCELQDLKLAKAAELVRRESKPTEDLSEQLAQARTEVAMLRKRIDQLNRENRVLKEDKRVQEDLESQAKMYASLLESMLDNVSDNKPVIFSSEDTSGRDAMKQMEKATQRLQQENKELSDMMDEFKAMWSKDSKNFQETMKSVKNEGKILQQEIARLERLRLDERSTLLDCYALKEEEEREHTKTKAAHEQLKNEIETLRIEYDKTSGELRIAVKQNDASEFKMPEQQSWLQCQSAELTTALDELTKSREKNAQQFQEMTECWRLKQNAYEEEMSEIKKQKEDEKIYHEMEKTDLADRAKESYSELVELRAEYEYTRVSLQEQLLMVRSESNLNYDRYVKFQTEAAKFEQSLKECKENGVIDSAIFAKTLNEVESKLIETMLKLDETAEEHDQTVAMLQKSEEHIANLKTEISSVKEDFTILHQRSEIIKNEKDQLHEQLSVTLRDCINEKEKMEQKQEDTIAAVQQRYTKQIEEIKYNNMLAVNQEMIKAQMALDSEKKKNTLQNEAVNLELLQAVSELAILKKDTSVKIASLNQEVITIRNHNVGIRSECADLKDSQTESRAHILRMKAYIEKLEQRAHENQIIHAAEIKDLKESHLKLVNNMGVEELDEEQECVEIQDKNESVEWELVEEN